MADQPYTLKGGGDAPGMRIKDILVRLTEAADMARDAGMHREDVERIADLFNVTERDLRDAFVRLAAPSAPAAPAGDTGTPSHFRRHFAGGGHVAGPWLFNGRPMPWPGQPRPRGGWQDGRPAAADRLLERIEIAMFDPDSPERAAFEAQGLDMQP